MAKNPVSFEEALKQFDRKASQQAVQLAEQERQGVVKRFPLDAWPNMQLSGYALGQGNKHESFCWWLEFGTPHVGSIKGGSARKHIIYKQASGEWWFDRQNYKTEQEAWAAVRAGFVDVFAKAQKGEWEAVDQLEQIGWGPALRTKTLYCYFPNDLLPISSISHIVHFLRLLGNEDANTSGYEVVRLNRLLLSTLRQKSELKGWNNKELERLLYLWADPRDQRKIVKIAPGADAQYWEECRDGGFICVGWDEMGDLRQFESREACQQRFNEAYGQNYNQNKSALITKCKELWTLWELEPGDLVVANKGKSKVLAVGEVVEPGYEWKEDRPYYRHIVRVKWDTSIAQDIPTQSSWGFYTIAPVPQNLAAQILGKKDGKTAVPVDDLYREIAEALARKGQVILYGPPGTGKTFTARRFSVWWLLKELGTDSPEILSDPKAFAQAEEKLSSAQVVRRVWWIVANPKEWSWDRLFKEKRVQYRYGRLQRNYPLVRRGDLVVGYQSTPDKRLVALARISREMFTNSSGEPSIELEPVVKINDGLTYDELQKDDTLNKSEPMQFRNQGTLFALTEDEFDHLAALLSEQEPDLRKHLEEGADAVGSLTRLTFHASYSYEDFIEGYRPVDSRSGTLSLKLEDGIFKRICRAAQANPKKPYLVLIDEINRANVAKVFGELITLLEKDKRDVLISLPQSKEAFTIPRNVYVLATMNTADRSIKLLDAALRRRFSFIELMPNPKLLAGAKVGTLILTQFLEELNRRIADNEGREKQIGHSYLMDGTEPVSEPEEFAVRFRQDILPLLQEYCYDDYRVLAKYIGNDLVDQEGQVLNEDGLKDADQLLAALEKEFTSEPPQ